MRREMMMDMLSKVITADDAAESNRRRVKKTLYSAEGLHCDA